jgi:hypothetical protein
MTSASSRRTSTVLVAALLSTAACATSTTSTTISPGVSAIAPSPDPRVGLKPGWFDAGEAIWNLEIVSKTPPSAPFVNRSTPGDERLKNSDLAFLGNLVFQGNYSGWQVWDISDPRKPTLRTAFVCPGAQSDVTVYRNLLFVSAEAISGRVDCGMQGITDTVSKERARGIRIYDITDVAHPKTITTVQTCRGSHTNTLVTDPNDPAHVYIYVSGSAGVRSHHELEGCSAGSVAENPNTALFRIEVIKVPLANPAAAAIVSSPRIFDNLTAPVRHAENPEDAAAAQARRAAAGRAPRPQVDPRAGPTQCHDITAYPAIGLAGGACSGYGFLLDIRDVANPKRVSVVADSNFSFWHSATFNNDGSKIMFTDEWGGGSQPRCRVTDKKEWGANAVFTLVGTTMTFKSYYKLPAPQTQFENCVAHNGSLIPVPGRDIMVQAWYQGGVSVLDWTDPANPIEIAYFDRGPMDATKLLSAGSWSAYWYNGYIVSSEIARGLDILELKPSAFLTQNEIDAAKLVKFDHFNAQEQPKLVWPAAFVVARAYVDQLVRGNGLSRDRTTAISRELARAETLGGAERQAALTALATQLDADARGAADAARVRALAGVVREIASGRR